MVLWGESSNPDGKIIFGLMVGSVLVEGVWYLWKSYSMKRAAAINGPRSASGDGSTRSGKPREHRDEGGAIKNMVLFFPDTKVACRKQFTSRNGCNVQNCRMSHDSRLSYSQLMRVLSSATRSIDVCVFCLTCHELTEILGVLVEKHLKIRVVTDSDQRDAMGSQVGALLKQGMFRWWWGDHSLSWSKCIVNLCQ